MEIYFTAKAFSKMTILIMSYSTEVAWHGVIARDKDKFTVEDILVYPQKVSAAFVDTDEEQYAQWLISQPEFSKIRMQCHSHVNMGARPSGTDSEFYADIATQIRDGDYYLFMIWNKRLECYTEIRHKDESLVESSKDILVTVEGIGNLKDFINKSNKNVKGNKSKEISFREWEKFVKEKYNA